MTFVFSSLSVACLRKLTDCCAKYGELFNIMYNANKSYCVVIDRKPQDMKNIHCVSVNLSNHPLPYIMKCKYLGHIINLLMMTTLPDKKDAFMHKLMF